MFTISPVVADQDLASGIRVALARTGVFPIDRSATYQADASDYTITTTLSTQCGSTIVAVLCFTSSASAVRITALKTLPSYKVPFHSVILIQSTPAILMIARALF